MKKYKLTAAVPGYIFMLQILILSLKKRVSIVMPKNKIMLFSFISLLSLLSVTCKNEVTAVGENIEPGRRDYVWEIDTLFSGSLQTYMVSMWGSSPQNLWICGHDGNTQKGIFYYNGTNWKTINLPATNYLKEFSVVEGIDSNNIYFAGSALYYDPNPTHNFQDSGMVLQYVNQSWKVHSLSNAPSIFSLAVNSSNTLWAGCNNGTILKYNGSDWEKFVVGNKETLINNIIYFNSIELYATGTSEKFIPGNGHYLAEYLYHFNGNFWNLIDSNITSTNYNRISFPTVLRNINGSLYGIMDGKFVKKNGNSWLTIKSGIYGQFNGNNNKNIFLANQDFGVLHYNGADWFRFEELPWFHYYDVEVFEDAVFFLATDGHMSYIVKGTIK